MNGKLICNFQKALFLVFLYSISTFSQDTLRILNEDSLRVLPKKALNVLNVQIDNGFKSVDSLNQKERWEVEGESYVQFIGGDNSRFQQNIDLEIKGELDSSVQIYGELRDSDLPSPGEGGEASLKDIDKAYLVIQGVRGGVELGDQSFSRGMGSWTSDESFLGVSANWNLDSILFIQSGLGVERIQKELVTLYGEEGVQGAYSLLSRSGVQVSEGSVELKLNGVPLEENIDFEIEEATGNLYFLATTFIRDGDVIEVRYSVSEEEALPLYARYADLKYDFGNQSVSVQFWEEGLRLDGSESQKINIESESYLLTPYLGDSVEYQLFEKREAYSFDNGVYTHIENVEEGSYVYFPQFVFVGESRGNYIIEGVTFVFVGEGNGDHLAGYLQKDSPDLQVLSLGYDGSKKYVQWEIDYSVLPQSEEAFVTEGWVNIDLPMNLYLQEDWLIRRSGFDLELINYDSWYLWRDLKVRELPKEELNISKSRFGFKKGGMGDVWIKSTTLDSDTLGVTRTEVGADLSLARYFELSQNVANVIDYKDFQYELNDYSLNLFRRSGRLQPRAWADYLEYYRSVDKQRGLRELQMGLGGLAKVFDVLSFDFDLEYDWAEDSLSRKTISTQTSIVDARYSVKLNSSLSWLDDLVLGEQSQNYLFSLKSFYRVNPRLGFFRFDFDYGYFRDQQLVKKYIRVEEGTGDVVFDERDSTYVEGVVFGDYILEGFVRDTSSSSVYSNNIEWDFDHRVVLGELLGVNTGFFNDLTTQNNIFWKSVDTSSTVSWLPQFEDEWNEGRFDLENTLIWKSGKHSVDLKRNLFHAKIWGLKKNRKLVWSLGQNSIFNKVLLSSNYSTGDYSWGKEQKWTDNTVGVKPGYRLPYDLKTYVLSGFSRLYGENFGDDFEVDNFELGNEWSWDYKKQILSASYKFLRTTGEFSKLPLRVRGDLLEGDYHNVQLNTQMELIEGIGLNGNLNVYIQEGRDLKTQIRVDMGGQF